MSNRHPLLDTLDTIIDGQIPNLLRLYVNPHVAQACFCLSRYARELWHNEAAVAPEFQSFLANSFDEALSGAIKLARYCADLAHGPKAGLILDARQRIGPLVSAAVGTADTIHFIPDLTVVNSSAGDAPLAGKKCGFVVVFVPEHEAALPSDAAALREREHAPLVIACVSRPALRNCRAPGFEAWAKLRPDIVVFDESFVNHHVPFAAFAARKELYDHWNQRGKTAFHSTTYQPNTISSLYFLRCAQRDDPPFFTGVSAELERIARDPAHRKAQFARLYSPALARAIGAVGWDQADIRAAGHYISVNGRKVFDGVAGVACSIRGHNPAGYREELQKLDAISDWHEAATQRLRKLTGLGNLLPAVSGASAVENALRLGLVAQYPRPYVLALKGGFGGKTLLALTGTANDSYKTRIDPLYPHVVYIDPFRDDAIEDLEAALSQYPVGVVQVELIQAVGGVRAVPERVLTYLQEQKQRHGYLLFVDEVQTGMYRTGPFLHSQDLGIEPDLLTVGKGTADMMFPFAVTLFADAVRDRLGATGSSLPEAIRQRYDYEFGYKTLINVLDRAEEARVSERVHEHGNLFRERLTKGLASCRAVRAVRVYGLLIALELGTRNWPRRWFKKQAGAVYVMNMLRHRPFPVFMGYCQYEPHVLKCTPPLSITRYEVEQTCATIVHVCRRAPHQLLPPLFGALARSLVKGTWESYRSRRSVHESAAR
jgi:acetylornithine/succinyldiaminopimelate/putrescine aminotransferase